MSINFSNIKWGWVVLGVVIAFAIAYGSSFCVVTGYASYLGFQARGAPDQTLINEFAARAATAITSIFIGVGTFVGGMVAGRKAKVDATQHGLVVGIGTAIVDLALSLSGGFSIWVIIRLVLAVGGGWLGGRMTRIS